MPRIVYLVVVFAMFIVLVLFGIPMLLELRDAIIMDLRADWYPVPPGQKSFFLLTFLLLVVVCLMKLWGNLNSKD